MRRIALALLLIILFMSRCAANNPKTIEQGSIHEDLNTDEDVNSGQDNGKMKRVEIL